MDTEVRAVPRPLLFRVLWFSQPCYLATYLWVSLKCFACHPASFIIPPGMYYVCEDLGIRHLHLDLQVVGHFPFCLLPFFREAVLSLSYVH